LKKAEKNVKTSSRKIASRFLKQDASAWLLLLPAVICLYFCAIRPQLIGFSWSFFDMKGYKIDGFVGIENYRRILNDTMFVKTLWNTCQYVIWSLLIVLLESVYNHMSTSDIKNNIYIAKLYSFFALVSSDIITLLESCVPYVFLQIPSYKAENAFNSCSSSFK